LSCTKYLVVRSGGPLSCSFLCCALSSVVVMNRFFAVRLFLSLSWPDSLPCVFLSAHGKEVFTVRAHTTKMACTAPLFFSVVCGYENEYICIQIKLCYPILIIISLYVNYSTKSTNKVVLF
jgi:hypothetical protein